METVQLLVTRVFFEDVGEKKFLFSRKEIIHLFFAKF